MATIGVKYHDSGIGTDLAKVLMKAVVGDPDTEMAMAKTEAALMGAQLDRQRTQAIIEHEAAEEARKQGVYDYAESAIDPATQLAMDAYERTHAPAPVAAAPVTEEPVLIEPEVDVDYGGNAGQIGSDLVPPTRVQTTTIPAEGMQNMPLLSQPGDDRNKLVPGVNDATSITFPDDTMPVPVDVEPVAPSPMPTLPAAPNVVGAPGDLTAPQPGFTGGAVDNKDGTITTPQGKTLSKAQVRAMVAVAVHDEDPYGALRKLTGQLGLTYGDTPEELEKAMILLGEDPTKLPQDLGGEAGGLKETDIAGMRKEIVALPSYKAAATVVPIYESMTQSALKDDRASDLDLVYGLATILDPTSVVRESDSVQIRNTASLPSWLQGEIAALNGGAKMLPDTRAKLLGVANSRVSALRNAFDLDAKRFTDIAKRRGYVVEDVIPTLGAQPDVTALTAPPPAGWTPEAWATLTVAEKQEVLADLAGTK